MSIGWGRRTRTFNQRNQNPLRYQLRYSPKFTSFDVATYQGIEPCFDELTARCCTS